MTTTTNSRNTAPAEPPEQNSTLRHRVAPAPLAPGASATATLLLRRVINHQPGRTTLPLARPGSGPA